MLKQQNEVSRRIVLAASWRIKHKHSATSKHLRGRTGIYHVHSSRLGYLASFEFGRTLF
jgi:hypothetical protein